MTATVLAEPVPNDLQDSARLDRAPGDVDEAWLRTRCERAQQGDRAARNEVVEAFLPLARALARRFAHRGEALEDLTQVALLGLVKAVERFDPTRGVPFVGFAAPTIVGELKRHFRDHGWGMRVPRRVQELHLRLEQASAALQHDLGRAPRPAELADAVGASEEEVLEAVEARHAYRPGSLDAVPVAPVDPDDAFSVADEREWLRDLLSQLPPREQRIVKLRFVDEMTQSQIAEEIGISQMHVSRLLARSVERLRELAQELAGDGA